MVAELRYSVRSFVRTPGLTLALLTTIALGVGSNAAVFAFIRGLVTSAERPVSVTERTVTVFNRDPRRGFLPISYDQYQRLTASETEFDLLGVAREADVRVTVDGTLSYLPIARVTSELAALLGITLDRGAVISDRLWKSQFNGAADLAARTLAVDGVEVRAGAVAPAWLDGLFTGRFVDIWLPLEESSLDAAERTSRTFWALGRLRDGISIDRAQAAIAAIDPNDELTMLPYTGVGPDAAAGLSQLTRLLPGAAALVFLIACANVMAFLLSRAAARAKETSVRVALGANRRQLLAALLADGVLIATAGAAAGALLAFWTSDIIPAMFFQEDAAHLRFAPDIGRILAVSATCALIVIACSLVPLMDLRHDRPADVLRRESAGPSIGVRRLRRALVIAQMACCSILIVSTAVLFQGLRAALQTTTGQHLGDGVIAKLEWRGQDGLPGREYFQRAEKTALGIDEVFAVDWAAALPGSRPRWLSFRVEPAALPTREVELHVVSFTPETVETIVSPPLSGRLFGRRDSPGSCPAVLLNHAAARLLFDDDPVGRVLEDPAGELVQVVGVVAMRPTAGDSMPRPTVYYYPEQRALPVEREGPAVFRAPILPNASSRVVINGNVVSPGYFARMGFTVAAGTLWTGRPAGRGCGVAVIDQEAAEQFFAGRALGGALIDDRGGRTEITGIIDAPRLRTTQVAVEPTIYFSMADHFVPNMTLIASVRDADAGTVATLQQSLGIADTGPRKMVMTLDEHLTTTALAAERIAIVLIGAASFQAVALAILGMYGAMADAVRRRGREFALRIALGAQRRRVIAHVIAEAARLAAGGALAGVIGSLVAAWWLAQITPVAAGLTIATAALGPLLIGLLILVACVLPARRAISANPLAMLRDH